MNIHKLVDKMYNELVTEANKRGITNEKDINMLYDQIEAELSIQNPVFGEEVRKMREDSENHLKEMIDRYDNIDKIKAELGIEKGKELWNPDARKKILNNKKNEGWDSFKNKIAKIETGSFKNKHIRTIKKGNSSAFGKYQITSGLASDMIKKNSNLFDESELDALNEMLKRQEVALDVGGDDKASYQNGGKNHILGKKLAEEFGYKNVDTFLNSFDYGGNLGFPKEKIESLDNAQEKILKFVFDKNDDADDAAAEWHGGSNWSDAGNVEDTKQYVKKFKNIKE